MTKHYRANTSISINVVLGNKKSMHVTFTPLSGGGSVYVTDNEEVQKALERHYKFGKLFRLTNAEDAPEGKPAGKAARAADGEGGGGARQVKVSDLASAKDYLADTFGISRTALRSEKAIRDAARAHGIAFEGL